MLERLCELRSCLKAIDKQEKSCATFNKTTVLNLIWESAVCLIKLEIIIGQVSEDIAVHFCCVV